MTHIWLNRRKQEAERKKAERKAAEQAERERKQQEKQRLKSELENRRKEEMDRLEQLRLVRGQWVWVPALLMDRLQVRLQGLLHAGEGAMAFNGRDSAGVSYSSTL